MPASVNACRAAFRKLAAATKGASFTSGSGKSSPSVTALIFTAEMVALAG
jgi:hypothetical protein